jgi:hypothetical protein
MKAQKMIRKLMKRWADSHKLVAACVAALLLAAVGAGLGHVGLTTGPAGRSGDGMVIGSIAFTDPSVSEAQLPPDRTTLDWPNPDFRTLQSAVDALADGGRLRIAPGEHPVDAPVFVRRKRVIIEGAGCAELPDKATEVPRRTAEVLRETGLDPRIISRVQTKLGAELHDNNGDGGERTFTQLVGPRPARVVSADETIGLFNFVDAGGAVTGLKLSGFDAGIVTRQEDLRSSPGSLVVTNTCIAETGRGVLAMGPGKFTMENIYIQNVLWNGISAVGVESLQNLLKQVSFVNVFVEDAGNACMVFKNVLGYAHQVYVHGCGVNPWGVNFGETRPGIGVVDSLFSITDSVADVSNPGILFVRSFGDLDDNILGQNKFAGMLLVESEATMSNNIIAGTQGRASDGNFGDGIDAFFFKGDNVPEPGSPERPGGRGQLRRFHVAGLRHDLLCCLRTRGRNRLWK